MRKYYYNNEETEDEEVPDAEDILDMMFPDRHDPDFNDDDDGVGSFLG